MKIVTPEDALTEDQEQTIEILERLIERIRLGGIEGFSYAFLLASGETLINSWSRQHTKLIATVTLQWHGMMTQRPIHPTEDLPPKAT